MPHNHHTHGEHHHAPSKFARAFAIGILLNVSFVIVEAFYGWRINSLALLADAGHNLSDVAGLVLAWVATIAAQRRPDRRHTYGWQRASILAALANALLLLMAMGSLLWEAIARLQSPSPTDGGVVMAVAAFGVLVNGVTAMLFMSDQKSDINIRGAYLHMAADALVSLGVVVAGALYLWTGWAWLDPLTSIVIGIVIAVSTFGLFRQSLHLAFDGVPDSIDLVTVETWLSTRPGVTGVHDLHVWGTGTTDIALTVHLVMPNGHPGDAFFNDVADDLHAQFGISHPTIQIEIERQSHNCVAPLPEH